MTLKRFKANRRKMRSRLLWRVGADLALLTGLHVWVLENWEVYAIIDPTVPY